jgi:hypothetical protein
MKKNILIIVVVIILGVVMGGSFYGGMVYGKNQKNNIRNFQQGNGNMQGFGNRQQGGVSGLIIGDIISKDDKSITVKLRDGGSKIIFYSNITQINKMATGTADDFAIGTLVSVSGITNSDGSVTAQSVQIRPAGQAGIGLQNSGL